MRVPKVRKKRFLSRHDPARLIRLVRAYLKARGQSSESLIKWPSPSKPLPDQHHFE